MHIPVVVTASGMTDVVYNDFYIAEGAEVVIVAGCGIHNAGCDNARHDGIHSFHVGKGANVRYEEKHYGEGDGTGERILNPVTKIYMDENSVFTLDTAQILSLIHILLNDSYIILIMTSDLFGYERYLYTFKPECQEVSGCILELSLIHI